ncbi:MAG: ATP synthase F1 subunit epsilon [Bacteroidetes bacterium]|nr:MAG: ATP synthase F1 subunit epsilon [Bacteroidota bacterium]
MKVEIVTPDKKVYEGEVDGVQLPGADGSFEILNNHAPIVATLAAGKLKVRTGKESEVFTISGGLVEMQKNKLIVLAESVSL